MKLINGIENIQACHQPTAVSIGNFDGVHRGHQTVIDTLLHESKRLQAVPTVITFEPLAKEYFRPGSVMRLTTITERAALLGKLGVSQVLCIEFTETFAAYSPSGFIDDILVSGLGAKYVCVGDDFRFGKNRVGDFKMLRDSGTAHGFEVAAHETYEIDGERVSSGRIRDALSQGQFDLAERLLGRPYAISGHVSKGEQRGRTIDYPTANIVLPDMVLPVHGVYAVTVDVTGSNYKGVANIGTRPTVDGKENRLEVHLFDFDAEIYDEHLSVRFVQKIRDEQKFASFEDLREQIRKDARAARTVLHGIGG